MIPAILQWICARLPQRKISDLDGRVYLLRARLFGDLGERKSSSGKKKKARCSVFLHQFFRPDAERDLHSHPWAWSFSVVLWGGYFEHRLVGWTCRGEGWEPVIKTRRRRAFTINFLGPNSFHRIISLPAGSCWTLFVAGPKDRDWHFLVKDFHGIMQIRPGWSKIPQQEYLRAKGYLDEKPLKEELAAP